MAGIHVRYGRTAFKVGHTKSERPSPSGARKDHRSEISSYGEGDLGRDAIRGESEAMEEARAPVRIDPSDQCWSKYFSRR